MGDAAPTVEAVPALSIGHGVPRRRAGVLDQAFQKRGPLVLLAH